MNGDGARELTMPATLTTARLVLRQFRREDAPDVDSFADDADYRRYLGPEHPPAAQFLANNVDGDWRRSPSWAIELEGRVVGGVFLGVDPTGQTAELACLVAPAHWREGLALEACRAVVGTAFRLGLRQLWARADAENAASIAAMERLGLHRDDAPRSDVADPGRAEVRYVIARAEWPQS